MPRFESVKITRMNIMFDWMNLINCRKLFLQQSSYFILLVFILSYSMLVIKFDLFFFKDGAEMVQVGNRWIGSSELDWSKSVEWMINFEWIKLAKSSILYLQQSSCWDFWVIVSNARPMNVLTVVTNKQLIEFSRNGTDVL